MKRALPLLVLALCAASASAQIARINPTRSAMPPADLDGFVLGPRYSNYSTTLDIELLTVETGRQHSFGLFGEYRSGAFMLDFNWDHDPENGFQIVDLLPFDVENYSRDRGEVMIGWTPHPYFDIQAGLRFDQVSIGSFTSDVFFGGRDFDHTGLGAGIKVHTPTNRPFGLYGLARGYLGSADFGDDSFGAQEDVMGRRLEGGIMIPIGETRWLAVPGIEYEYFEIGDREMAMETNRFFVNFVYRFDR
jgi:hypothetical protein